MELIHRSLILGHHRGRRLAPNAHLAMASLCMLILCGLVMGAGELVTQSAAGTKMPDGIGLVLVNLLAVHLG